MKVIQALNGFIVGMSNIQHIIYEVNATVGRHMGAIECKIMSIYIAHRRKNASNASNHR